MVADKDNPDAKRGVVVLRIDPKVEDGKLIYQIGTGEAGLAVQAVERIVGDVVGVDVNMGCPKKFSVSGGMGRLVVSLYLSFCWLVGFCSLQLVVLSRTLMTSTHYQYLY